MWIWFVMPGCAILLIILWFIFGRDKKTILTITTSPPEGLDPLEMEYAQIATISDRGIYAQLLYWVSKGILTVRNEEKRIGMDILPYALLFNMGTKWTAAFENKTIYACVEEIEKIEEQNDSSTVRD